MTDSIATANYMRSYNSMWDEIRRARSERDAANQFTDVTRDLIIALDHDLGGGDTKISQRTHEAFRRLRAALHIGADGEELHK